MIQTQREKEQMCLEHNESAIYFDFSTNDQRPQNRCLRCVERQQLWVDVQVAEKQFENVKRTVWSEKQALHQNNLEILQGLFGQLKEFKTTFNTYIDKTLQNMDQQIQFIKNGIEKENKSISELSISQLDQLESQNTNQQHLFIDYKELQNCYKEQINRLKMHQQFTQFEENLKKIEYNQQNLIKDVIQTFSSEIFQQSRLSNQNWQCENHKLQVALVDLNEQATVPNRMACIDCVTEYPIKYTKLEQLKQLWLSYVDNTLKYQEQQQQQLEEQAQKAMSKFSSYREVITDLSQQLIQGMVFRDVSQCKATQNLINLKTKNWYQLNKLEIIEISNILSQKNKFEVINEAIKNEFQIYQVQLMKKILNSFKSFQEKLIAAFQQISGEISGGMNISEINEQTNNSIGENSLQIQPQNLQLKNQNTQMTQFKYEIINSFKEERVETFAFNADYSLVAAGFFDSSKINIYEFNQGQIEKIQELRDHEEYIICLKFFKKSNQLVSGSYDKTIIIWEKNNNNLWGLKFKLIGHKQGIFCIAINNNENWIISSSGGSGSGSGDYSIKVWDQDKEWQCIQTLPHKFEISSFSLSQSNEYLVSCSRKDNSIQIFKLQNNHKNWSLFQKIDIEEWGIKVCFLEGLTFAFQPFNNKKMQIFSINDSNDQFIKKQDVQVEAGNDCYFHFPLQFVQTKLMIVDRNGSKVNIIKKQENGTYVTQLVLDYDANRIFGTMTEDGKFLITWDNKYSQIQIRQYQE
ncbi:unnamed protein product [Paramecium octaurelia]|uniref:WD40-repeat-containing domain n=1 Tax=Paramecium octaurelia TaxID=43137 RepID=A0A8S1X5W1_PAROT|nr:unnamed protein product [Paramecium octaurelia]